MAFSLTDTLENLMTQYTLKIDSDTVHESLTCIICSKIVHDVYKTYCGCLYCRKCIIEYLEDGNKYCCGNKNECNKERIVFEKNVLRNSVLNEIILQSRVHCPNVCCSFITELNKMYEHLRDCDQQPVECPYSLIGCDTENLSEDGILHHLQDGTLSHSLLLIELIHNLKNEINGLKEDYGICKLEISNMKEELKMKDIQMGEQRRNMDKQETEINNQKMESTGLREELKCIKDESASGKIVVESVKKEMAIMREYSRNIKNTVETSERESTKYRDETRSTLTKMREKGVVTKSMMSKIDDLTKTVAVLNVGTNTKVAVGQLSFIVERFSARKAAKEVIFSPYFYSHTNGYKLRLRLCPAGIRDGKGTYFSVCSIICRGEYDDLLPWPCRHTFTVDIIDQSDGEVFTSATVDYSGTEDSLRYTFDKPIDKDNHEMVHHIVTHDDLESVDGLVVHDSVVVRCAVTAPS